MKAMHNASVYQLPQILPQLEKYHEPKYCKTFDSPKYKYILEFLQEVANTVVNASQIPRSDL